MLTWIMVGTGPVDPNFGVTGSFKSSGSPNNRGYVLDRYGSPVFYQNKNFGFTLINDQLDEWKLDEKSTNPQREVLEDITPGERVEVRDAGLRRGRGIRVALLICEDFGQPEEFMKDLKRIGVSLILTPVFAKPFLGKYPFPHGASDRYALKIGAWVVVANSLVVGRAQGITGPLPIFARGGPPPLGEAGWVMQWDPKECNEADEVVFLEIPIDRS